MGDREPPAKPSRDLAPRQHPCVCIFQWGRVDGVHQLQTPSAENVSAALGAEGGRELLRRQLQPYDMV